MSPLATRRLLWLALIVALPVPMLGLETGLVPVLRLLLLGGFTAGVALQDPDVMSQLFTAMFLGQAALWIALEWWLARLVVGRLPARAPWLAIAALAILSLLPVYATPYSKDRASSSILQILD